MSKSLKPGQAAPRSGQYAVVGPRGGNTGREVTVTKGEPMPPRLFSPTSPHPKPLCTKNPIHDHFNPIHVKINPIGF